MKKFQVITDSTADIEKKFREQYDIKYVKMSFQLNNKNYGACLDWSEISDKDFFGQMRKGNRPITSLVSTGEFETAFEDTLKEGLDILYVACSSKLSASVNNAKIVAEELKAKYPERKIVCYDSLRSCYAEGLMAMDAAKMASDGKTIDEAVAYFDEYKLNYQTFATVGTLDWLKKAGRVKASTAFFGNLLGVKPIIVSDTLGNNYGFKKVKGRKNSLDELINIACERVENPSDATIYVEHADSLADANYVADAIKAKISPKEINISSLGPIIGASVGPDTLLLSFYGKKIDITSGE